jgi:hypothetical protein
VDERRTAAEQQAWKKNEARQTKSFQIHGRRYSYGQIVYYL